MTIEEKIADKEAAIKKEQQRIAASQAKIAKCRREIETLENLRIKDMLKEIDLPFSEVCKLLRTMRPTPTVEPGDPGEAPQ